MCASAGTFKKLTTKRCRNGSTSLFLLGSGSECRVTQKYVWSAASLIDNRMGMVYYIQKADRWFGVDTAMLLFVLCEKDFAI